MKDQGLMHSPEDRLIPTGDVPNTVADILTAAADLIEPEGRWTRYVWFDTNTTAAREGNYRGMCMEGAIILASGCEASELEATEAYAVVKEVILEDLSVWNDDESRTQAEVVAALRQAAEKARVADSIERPSVGISALSGNETQDPTKEGEG